MRSFSTWFWVGATLLALLAGQAAWVTPAQATSPCLVLDAEGSLSWSGGEEHPSAMKVAMQLQAELDAHPDQLTAVGFCHDRQSIWVSGPAVARSPAVALIASTSPVPIVKVNVANSREGLRNLQQPAIALLTHAGGIFSVGIVGWEAKVSIHLEHPDGELASQLRALLGDHAQIRKQPKNASGSGSYDRWTDYSPFQSGGWVSPGCSLGPRVWFLNQYMMLTAGHCGKQSPFKSGLGDTIGSLYTTSWSGNAYRYGDWSLIYGGAYSNRVFSGSASGSQDYIDGEGINWGGYPTGAKICSSGITTGQVCAWIVTGDDITNNRASDDGLVTIGPMIEMRYDPNNGGNPNDCYYTGQGASGPAKPWIVAGTSRAGDSGGANYHRSTATPPRVTYDGLTTGQYWYEYFNQKRCLYYSSQLKGVRNFAPSVGW